MQTENGRHIVVLDEFPYAVASEPALPSVLQNAWDHHLRFSNVCLIPCGSQVGMMEQLMHAHAPLYGRMVKVRDNIFRETGLFRTDPDYLIGEEVRDLANYQAVLWAIAGGGRRPAEIALAAGLPSGSTVDPYLARLVEMGYVRRELPVTVEPKKRATSRLSRYVLADHYLRFYFRFVRPHLDILAQQLYDQVWERIGEQPRAFVEMTAFEELCQAWVLTQARAGRLPFAVEQVGGHGRGGAQVDVAAISWREKALLLGEARWATAGVGRDGVRELIDKKTPHVLKALAGGGEGWTVHYVFYAGAGFTSAARAEAEAVGADQVDLERLGEELRAVSTV